ncbi:MAG: holo-ACP synthase [Lachnospiraceae bacterium]|nr:holo-ACP synthase [Lachnospiraceae bacterium]
MIIGVGTDIIETERIKKALEREGFLKNTYTDAEAELIKKRPASAAGNFAAKEAVAKALGSGFSGFGPKEVEILRDKAGKPFVNLYGGAKKKAEEINVNRIHVSISDVSGCAVGMAVAEGE